MRKWLPLAIGLALLLAFTPFALAAGNGKAHAAHKAAHTHAQGKAKGKNKKTSSKKKATTNKK